VAPVAPPARRWPLGWVAAAVLLLDGGVVGWCVAYLFYGSKIPAGYFPYFFGLGPGLLGVLAGVGLFVLGMAVKNAFRRQWRRAFSWLLLAMLSGGSAGLGSFPVAFVVGAGIADDGHQSD
jgi:hypothetical protein